MILTNPDPSGAANSVLNALTAFGTVAAAGVAVAALVVSIIAVRQTKASNKNARDMAWTARLDAIEANRISTQAKGIAETANTHAEQANALSNVSNALASEANAVALSRAVYQERRQLRDLITRSSPLALLRSSNTGTFSIHPALLDSASEIGPGMHAAAQWFATVAQDYTVERKQLDSIRNSLVLHDKLPREFARRLSEWMDSGPYGQLDESPLSARDVLGHDEPLTRSFA